LRIVSIPHNFNESKKRARPPVEKHTERRTLFIENYDFLFDKRQNAPKKVAKMQNIRLFYQFLP